MNIYKKLPDDIQEIISTMLHQSQMKSIQKELEDRLDQIWFNNDDDDYIPCFYATEHAIYRLYDENSYLIRPEKVAFNGYCKFYINNYSSNKYPSSILVNPTYGEIFLEVDRIINEIFENGDDIDDLSLEEVYEWGETEYDETYGNVKIIQVDLR